MTSNDLLKLREELIKKANMPPDSKIEITAEGVFIQRIDDSSFCCGTTLCEAKIKVLL